MKCLMLGLISLLSAKISLAQNSYESKAINYFEKGEYKSSLSYFESAKLSGGISSYGLLLYARNLRYAKFDWVSKEFNGKVTAIMNNRGFLMDTACLFIQDLPYKTINPPNKNFIIVQDKKNKSALFDLDGNKVIDFQYKLFEISDFGKMVAQNEEKKYGVLDTRGKNIIPFQYEGLWPVPKFDKYIYEESKKYGILDGAGNKITEPLFEKYLAQDSCFFLTVQNGKYVLYNLSSNKTLQLECDEAQFLSSGLITIKKGNKWGYMNSDGFMIIQPQFEVARAFLSGNKFARVKIDGKWGVINSIGNYLARPIFDTIYAFSNNEIATLGRIEKGRYKIIFNNSSEQLDFQTDYIRNFSDGLAAFSVNKKWGFVTPTKKIVIQPIYDSVTDFKYGWGKVYLNGVSQTLNAFGNCVRNCISPVDEISDKIEEYTKRKDWENAYKLCKSNFNAFGGVELSKLYNWAGYYFTDGKENCDSAIYYYTKAADLGNENANANLGYLYNFKSEKCPQYANDKKSFLYNIKDAALFHSRGLVNLAECYRQGTGVSQNIDSAIKYALLSLSFQNGDHTIFVSSLELITQLYYFEKKDYKKAYHFALMVDSSNYSSYLSILLAQMLLRGEGTEKNVGAAIKILEQCIVKGESEAMAYLAAQYDLNGNAYISYGKALELYEQAIKTDENPKAYAGAGFMYYFGRGIYDREKGLQYLKYAAGKGNVNAIKFLKENNFD